MDCARRPPWPLFSDEWTGNKGIYVNQLELLISRFFCYVLTFLTNYTDAGPRAEQDPERFFVSDSSSDHLCY